MGGAGRWPAVSWAAGPRRRAGWQPA